MSSLLPSSATNPHPQRAPPPSLFLGPPSRNASNISLTPAPPAASQARAPLLRSRSTRAPDPSAPLGRARPTASGNAQTEGDRTDALWAEMQATLAEVELSAFSSTHVFGSAHSAALEELREAQIELAKAWGKGEVDEEEMKEQFGEDQKGKDEADREGDGESDEERDILEAKRRREANEKFFSKVGEGVKDVAGKLDCVAQAMAKVEQESREIWSGMDSVESGSSGS